MAKCAAPLALARPRRSLPPPWTFSTIGSPNGVVVDEIDDWECKSGPRMDVFDDWEIKMDERNDSYAPRHVNRQ